MSRQSIVLGGVEHFAYTQEEINDMVVDSYFEGISQATEVINKFITELGRNADEHRNP